MNLMLLAGSLAAILTLYGFAHMLKLGGDVRLQGKNDALALAESEGFDATAVAIDRGGLGAIARDAQGRHLLIRRHGVNWVSRVVAPPLDARLDKNFLTLGTNERAFGRITFDLGSAAAEWAASLRRVR